jgi:hypothetical protein
MKASGALPETSPLYAPCLKRRPRAGGKEARYFVVPVHDIEAGYLPKTMTIPAAFTELEAALACRKWWSELVAWRDQGDRKAVSHTIGWLVDRYMNDPFSKYMKIRGKSRRGYDQNLRAIQATKGRVPLALVTGPDILRWHDEWGHPEPVIGTDGKREMDFKGNPVTRPSHPSRQRAMVVMLRILFSHAVLIDAPEATRIRGILSAIEFPVPKGRDVSANREQVNAFVKQAIEDGYLSQAITTLAQFELMERRVHIIGYFENRQWRPGWVWQDIDWRGENPTWKIRYYQSKVGLVRREFDLNNTPELLALLKLIPEEHRVGPVIIMERQKLKDVRKPWEERYYAEVWRQIGDRAGIPQEVCSMDMRASAATEADELPGVTDRALQDAGGWNDPKTPQRYRRNKQRNAGEVVKMRQANRTSGERS